MSFLIVSSAVKNVVETFSLKNFRGLNMNRIVSTDAYHAQRPTTTWDNMMDGTSALVKENTEADILEEQREIRRNESYCKAPPATIVEHNVPHRGDLGLLLDIKTESLFARLPRQKGKGRLLLGNYTDDVLYGKQLPLRDDKFY